jgi:Ni/Co efflux regulator RcnB
MRNFSSALLGAAAILVSVSTSALAQATNDIDAIESRQRVRERAQERTERAREQRAQVEVQQAPQEQRQVFQPRAERQGTVDGRRSEGFFNRRGDQQQANVEVRRDRGDFERRAGRDQNRIDMLRDEIFSNRRGDQQRNVEVRREDRRFDRRQGGIVTGTITQDNGVVVQQNTNRNDGRRFEESNGQRFGRNDEYRSDRDDRRRFDRDDYRRRGEIARDGNWYRDGNGKWQRRDGLYYGNRDYGYNSGKKDFRWNRDWRKDSRYDWKSYRFSNRNFFRQSRYYDPFGSRYGYQRFSIGIRIGSGYYNDRYWISDPFAYRLPYADGPYRWVRYYDDVLLIDLRNGAVVDVIYDFFW